MNIQGFSLLVIIDTIIGPYANHAIRYMHVHVNPIPETPTLKPVKSVIK